MTPTDTDGADAGMSYLHTNSCNERKVDVLFPLRYVVKFAKLTTYRSENNTSFFYSCDQTNEA